MTERELLFAERLQEVLIAPDESLTAAIARLDRAGTGMLLVVDGAGRLAGVLSDGDIRRAILAGVGLGEPCGPVANARPMVAPEEVDSATALELMDHGRGFQVSQLPLVDKDGRAVGLLLRRDLVTAAASGVAAVIMAGGFGTRLHPLTVQTPKPMLPVGDRPLLERTIEGLRRSGISRVNITTHYLPEKISDHFGDGHEFGVDLRYVAEDQPLGTAGALTLMDGFEETLLVINGDILTGVRFEEMLAYHREHGADLTVGVRQHQLQIPYGVVECQGPQVAALREKPLVSVLINAGIYLLEPTVQQYIPQRRRFDMTELIQRLLDEGRPVVSFPIVEYWLDIGQHADYERAQEDIRLGRL